MAWIIVNSADESLAWSNYDGWTEDCFDSFTDDEHETLNLPIGGEWRQVPWKVED